MLLGQQRCIGIRLMTDRSGKSSTRERRILKAHAPLVTWKMKSLKEMTDQDCIDCLNYLRETTGIIYVESM